MRRVVGRVAAAAAAAAVLLAVGVPPVVAPAQTSTGLYTVAGAIRCTSTGEWQVLDDAGHTPLGGLVVLGATDVHVQLGYDTAAEIHSLIVAPDETLASQGVTVGASAGYATAYVYFADPAGPRDPTPCGSTSGNLWVHGLMTAAIPDP